MNIKSYTDVLTRNLKRPFTQIPVSLGSLTLNSVNELFHYPLIIQYHLACFTWLSKHLFSLLSSYVNNSDVCPGILWNIGNCCEAYVIFSCHVLLSSALTPEMKAIFSRIEIPVHNGIQGKRIDEERRCLHNHWNRVFGTLYWDRVGVVGCPVSSHFLAQRALSRSAVFYCGSEQSYWFSLFFPLISLTGPRCWFYHRKLLLRPPYCFLNCR